MPLEIYKSTEHARKGFREICNGENHEKKISAWGRKNFPKYPHERKKFDIS